MNNEEELYEVTNSDGSILRFTGEIVARVSSEVPEKGNWTEFILYLTSFDTWVLQGIGKTRIPGQKDRPWYVVTSEPRDWLEKILGDDVSRLAKNLLNDAFKFLQHCPDCDDVPERWNEV